MEKYFVEGRGYGVLISPGYGWEFSARMHDQSVAIDKRVIEAAYECADAVVPHKGWGTDFDELRGFNKKKFSKTVYFELFFLLVRHAKYSCRKCKARKLLYWRK